MRDRLAAISQQLGAAAYALVLALSWLHATFVRPVGTWLSDGVLPVYEESVKAVVREWFAVLSRSINSASAFLLSLLSGRSYRRTAARVAVEKQQAWHRWWRSASGTFNALIEQEGLTGPPPAARNGDSAAGSSRAGREGGGGGRDEGSSSSSARRRSSEGGAPQLPRLPVPQRAASGRGQAGGPKRAASQLSSSMGAGAAPPTPVAAEGEGGGRGWRPWRWLRRSGSSSRRLEEVPGTPRSDLRRGSVLFELPSGFAVSQMVSSRGLLEDLRVGTEVAVGRAFGAARRGLRRLFFLDAGGSGGTDRDSPADLLARRMRRATPPPMPPVAEESPGRGQGAGAAAGSAAVGAQRQGRRSGRRPPLKSLLRSGRHWEEDLSVWTASDVILREGYPLEQHSVTTTDGYVLQMHRIPRHGARDVAFFQHGVLDTSLGWVCNGVVGSAAFAAYDAGFDVWLANSRSNAPRLNVDPERQGAKYWRYSINELSIYDLSAEITHIHNTKMAELAVPGRHVSAAQEAAGGASPFADANAPPQLRRAATDSLLDALRWVDVRSGGSRGDLEQGATVQQQGGQRSGRAAAASAAGGPPSFPVGEGDGDGEEEEGGGRSSIQEGRQPWWQRLAGRRGGRSQHADLGFAPMERGATSLRRSQSAAEPLQQGQQEGLGHVAVPISTRSMQREQQQQQQQQAGGREGSGRGGTAGLAAAGSAQEVLPYRLQAVGHSLGAATLLVYTVVCRMRGQPHRLRRLVLMSPAGFHPRVPRGLAPCTWLFPAIVWVVDRVPGLRQRGMGLRLPSPLLRYITFKFTMDLRHMPALNDLVKGFMKMMMSGDSSQWDAALQMPHYSTYSMPALSLHCGAHFAQWANDLSFRLFDYGSKAANRRHYGTDRPPSVADNYRLLDVPVDLLAGSSDGVISPACVALHAQRLRAAGVPCSFRILPYAHMDFTFAVKEDIRLFVLSKLRSPL